VTDFLNIIPSPICLKQRFGGWNLCRPQVKVLKGSAYKVLLGKFEGQKQLGRPMKIWEALDWTGLTLVNTIMNLYKMLGIFE
jgi:hypothetical protein